MIVIKNNFEIQEDKKTIKGKISERYFTGNSRIMDGYAHHSADKKFEIYSGTLVPYLQSDSLDIGIGDKIIEHKCASEKEAVEVMNYINEFTINK